MKYLGYSELTKRIYILPASKKAAKVDITEDIKELMAFFKKDTFSILSGQITALQSSLKEKEEEISALYGKLEYAMKGYPEQEKVLIETQVILLTNLLKEKEKECEVWKQSNSGAVELYKKSLKREHEKYKELEELKAENERLKDALEDLAEAVPKQTKDADWWDDNLTNAFYKAQELLNK